jgi:hypothetical protein
MTDLDIIERVAALFQTDIFTLLPKKPNRKTAYRVAARGAYGARWMKLLYPYMGKRRKRQIRKSLTIYENRPYNAKTRVKACQKAAKGRQRNERGQFT